MNIINKISLGFNGNSGVPQERLQQMRKLKTINDFNYFLADEFGTPSKEAFRVSYCQHADGSAKLETQKYHRGELVHLKILTRDQYGNIEENDTSIED